MYLIINKALKSCHYKRCHITSTCSKTKRICDGSPTYSDTALTAAPIGCVHGITVYRSNIMLSDGGKDTISNILAKKLKRVYHCNVQFVPVVLHQIYTHCSRIWAHSLSQIFSTSDMFWRFHGGTRSNSSSHPASL